jgi:hypothetical protein
MEILIIVYGKNLFQKRIPSEIAFENLGQLQYKIILI